MTRIGSNSGSNRPNGLNSKKLHSFLSDSKIIPQDPFIEIEKEAVDGWNFHHLSRLITWGLSKEWFAEFAAIPALDYLRNKCGDAYEAWAKFRWGGSNWFELASIRPAMLINSEDLGTLIPLNTGSLTPALLGYLDSRDVISHEFAVTYADKKLIKAAQPMLWTAAFETSFGTRCAISIESHVDQFGVERCHLFTNLVVNSRSPDVYYELAHSGVRLDLQNLRSNFTLPLLLPRLMYLAETPLPSAFFSMSRTLAFKDVPLNLIPKPIMSVEDFSIAYSHPPNTGGTKLELDIYPQMIRVGYEITSEMIEVFEGIIPTCIDSLIRACSIVEDGFRNYRDPNKPQSFDFEFLSDGVFSNELESNGFSEAISESERWIEGKQTGGMARWIPETHLSALRYNTIGLLSLAHQERNVSKKIEIFKWIANEGIGSLAVASAINTLTYSYLIPERKFEAALFYLDKAASLEAVNESTNAMANIGHIFYLMGDIDDAIYCLKLTLDREDKFAETEASMLLGEIFLSRNNKAEAIEYLQRGARGPDDKFSLRCKELLEQI
jgi:hypothetical protein